MKVNMPTVGPIVGYADVDQSRIFLRGDLEREGQSFRRCFGVVRWRQIGSEAWSKPLFNKLSPNFDMTGVFVVTGLSPETTYEYQAGWFFADSELEGILALNETQLDWPQPPTGFEMKLTTSTSDSKATRHFIVGSCRYLLRLYGALWFDDRGDKTFRTIVNQIDQALPVDALFMIGDQIYADDLNFISPIRGWTNFLNDIGKCLVRNTFSV